jgi:glycosyltransferase involved in cell wall biosynthesis
MDRVQIMYFRNKYRGQKFCPISGNLRNTKHIIKRTFDPQSNQKNDSLHPNICLGMPLYNQTEFLIEALQSLLAQTYRDFRLVVVDDSTESEPGEIVKEFALKDKRICYVKNEFRKGLVDNWKACFQQAGPVDYFAWVSDHDIWHPEWLASMVQVLDARPNVLLVYPKTVYISDIGQRIPKRRSQSFSTEGLTESQRIKAVCRDARYFGKKVYGLFRASALRRAGVFRRVLFPDLILLLEICRFGDFKQVDNELWYLRRIAQASTARQRSSLFLRKPWYIYFPWPIVNMLVLAWNTALRPGAGNLKRRYLGLKIALMYFYRWIAKLGRGSRIGSFNEWRKGKLPWMKKLKKWIKQSKWIQKNHRKG